MTGRRALRGEGPPRPHCNLQAASAYSSVSMNQIEALYRQHASAVFRFAWGLCGDRGLAEDIVSETYVRLLTRAPEIETQTALAYLLAIARSVPECWTTLVRCAARACPSASRRRG